MEDNPSSLKDAIINKTVEFLNNYGVSFRLAQIASSLEISKKTIYKIFKDKEDLADQAFLLIYSNVTTAQSRLLSNHDADLDTVKALFLGYMELLRITDISIYNIFSLSHDLHAKFTALANDNWNICFNAYKSITKRNLDESAYKLIFNSLFKNVYHGDDRLTIAKDCLNILII